MQNAVIRVPALEHAPVQRLINGPESFTPDNQFLLGEAPEVKRFFVGAGFNSAGIASAGGAGKALAEWIVAGHPTMDLWPVDIRRFARWHGNERWLRERMVEAPGLHYAVAYPAARLQDRARRQALAAPRAPRQARAPSSGRRWAGSGRTGSRPAAPGRRPSIRSAAQNWMPCSAAEHRAAREAVAVFDQTSFSKFLLEGRDAESVLQRLCANDVAVPPGKVVYTGMLNERGGYESDLTVTRLASRRLLHRDRHRPGDARRRLDQAPHPRRTRGPALTDVTSSRAVLAVMGPRSRALLERLTDSDLSNAAFPFGTMQEIGVGHATVRAIRITYVGELGWELYIPVECAAGRVRCARRGRASISASATRATTRSTRSGMEKGYRAWGHDVTPDDTPLEAGPRVRRQARQGVADSSGARRSWPRRSAASASGSWSSPSRTMEARPWGDEPILRDGALVGWVTSAAFGHTLGCPVAMGYVRNADGVDRRFIESGAYEIEIAGDRVRARAHLRAPYDPDRRASARVMHAFRPSGE